MSIAYPVPRYAPFFSMPEQGCCPFSLLKVALIRMPVCLQCKPPPPVPSYLAPPYSAPCLLGGGGSGTVLHIIPVGDSPFHAVSKWEWNKTQ